MTPHVVCIGPHIVDVLVRPVTAIPPGQGGALIEDARITAAGTAAGTAVDLAKLGARVTSIGAIGSDSLGRLLRLLLEDNGVETDRLVTREGGRTSTTILPIRPNGERPTLHLPGVTASLTAADVDHRLVADADVLHLGGPDVLGAFATEVAPGLLQHARASGTTTTVDLLRSGAGPDVLELLTPLWPWVDFFLPNDDQLRSMTGLADLERAAGGPPRVGGRHRRRHPRRRGGADRRGGTASRPYRPSSWTSWTRPGAATRSPPGWWSASSGAGTLSGRGPAGDRGGRAGRPGPGVRCRDRRPALDPGLLVGPGRPGRVPSARVTQGPSRAATASSTGIDPAVVTVTVCWAIRSPTP